VGSTQLFESSRAVDLGRYGFSEQSLRPRRFPGGRLFKAQVEGTRPTWRLGRRAVGFVFWVGLAAGDDRRTRADSMSARLKVNYVWTFQ
jgi:hypothetical protein